MCCSPSHPCVQHAGKFVLPSLSLFLPAATYLDLICFYVAGEFCWCFLIFSASPKKKYAKSRSFILSYCIKIKYVSSFSD